MKRSTSRSLGIILACALLASCDSRYGEPVQFKKDSTRSKPTPPFKPGFGEFMSSVQVHHEKLYFAAKAGNWALADFEMHEIGEAMDDLRTYCTDRPETAKLDMITPPLDSVSAAINRSDSTAFFRHFTYLTMTCNNCHQATDHGFNRIVIPTRPPFSNQDFNPVNGQ